MFLEHTTLLCIVWSYGLALGLELFHLFRPNRPARLLVRLFAAAGLVAHTVYIFHHALPLTGEPSSLLLLAWVLGIFYLFGAIHHARQAWGVFVLPVVLALVLVAGLVEDSGEKAVISTPPQLRFWAWLHFGLLILGAVGLCVAFVSSVMYLTQSWKLKHKTTPGEGLRLLSLERLETMNRRAINLAFPLFTAGLLIGVFLLARTDELRWNDPKVLTTAALWLVFLLLMYLRYGLHVRGRRVAFFTIVAFGLLVLAFAIELLIESAHRFGGGP
jgi:ABC-type transport system involved in cytochrome c biogenesis permease subunit